MGQAKPEIEIQDYVEDSLGVSRVFPPYVAARLLAAAARAREMPADSLERRQEIEKAIYFARTQCPQAFKGAGDNSRSK